MENWKDVPNYEGLYQISDLGRVKSLRRLTKDGSRFFIEKIMKPKKNRSGYYSIAFTRDGIREHYEVHLLVALAFLKYKPNKGVVAVDHINEVKTDNRLENLRIISHRMNVSRNRGGTSNYTGVSWRKRDKKWISKIRINGKAFHLGYFENEIDAANAYKEALKKVKSKH